MGIQINGNNDIISALDGSWTAEGAYLNTSGIATATTFKGNVTGTACTFVDGNFTGNVTIGGTLTYEDVTNIDAVGLVTARNGLKVLSAGANITGNSELTGVLTLDPTNHEKLKLRAPAGESNDWSYMSFFGTDGNRNGYIGADATGDLVIQRDGGKSLFLDSTGLGIGESNPDTLLELSSTVSGTGDLLKITSTTNSQSSRPGISFWNNNPNTAQAQISAKGGASYNASKLHFAVANTSRTLVDRACIDEYGTFIIGPGEVRRNTKGSNQYQALLVEGTGNNSSRMSMIRSSNDDNGPEIQIIKTRGTSVGSVTKPNQNDYLGAFTFLAGDDSDLFTRGAEIGVQATGTPANDRCPSDIIFSTTPTSGATTPQERLRIASDGIVTSSATHPQIILKDPDSRQVSLRAPSTSNLAALGTDTNHALIFYTNGYSNERLRIASDGEATFSAENININRNAGDPFIALQTSGTSNVVLYGGASTGFRVFTKPSGGSLTARVKTYPSGKVTINPYNTFHDPTHQPTLTLSNESESNLYEGGKWSHAAIGINNTTHTASGGSKSQIVFGYLPRAGGYDFEYGSAYMGATSVSQSGAGKVDLVFGTKDVTTDTQPTERLRITSGGLVQIDTPGVTAGNGASAKLQVDSSSQYDGLLLGNSATYGTISRGASNGALVYTANAYPANLGGGDPVTHEWWSGSAGGGGPSKLMVLTATGNVGINDSTPTFKLDVNGTGRFTDDLTIDTGKKIKSSSSQGNITIQAGPTYPGGSIKLAGGQSGATDRGTMIFYVGETTSLQERVRLDSSGRFIVGGGTHAGGGQLVVMGGNMNTYGCVHIGAKITNPGSDVQLSQVRFGAGSGGTSLGASITAKVPGGVTWSENSSHPTDVLVSTCNNNSASQTEKFRIYANGSVRIMEELEIARNTNANSNFTKSGKVLDLPGYKEFHYTWQGQASYTIDLTCASYFHCEFIYTQHQTNGGNEMHYYARGKWANNHVTHTGYMYEMSGDGAGLSVSFTVSDQSGNGSVDMKSGLTAAGAAGASYRGLYGGGNENSSSTANGRLRIAETYHWGSVSTRSLIVKVYYGSFSISKS